MGTTRDDYRTTIVEQAPHTVLRLRRTVHAESIGAEAAEGVQALYTCAGAAHLLPAGPPAITYLGGFGNPAGAEALFSLPVLSAGGEVVPEGAELVLDEAQTVACTTHRGSYRTISAAHRALADSLAATGHHATGAPSEVYLVGPDAAADDSGLVTEVRVPVAADTKERQ